MYNYLIRPRNRFYTSPLRVTIPARAASRLAALTEISISAAAGFIAPDQSPLFYGDVSRANAKQTTASLLAGVYIPNPNAAPPGFRGVENIKQVEQFITVPKNMFYSATLGNLEDARGKQLQHTGIIPLASHAKSAEEKERAMYYSMLAVGTYLAAPLYLKNLETNRLRGYVRLVEPPAHIPAMPELPSITKMIQQKVTVQNADTLKAAIPLFDPAQPPPAILVFANAFRPGGPFEGASAQEEDMARYTAYLRFWDVYAHLFERSTLYNAKSPRPQVIPSEAAVLFTNVPLVRKSNGDFLDPNMAFKQPRFHFVVSAAPDMRNPHHLPGGYDRFIRRCIHAQFEAAVKSGSKTLIWGAWGYGVFKNQPEDIAKAYREILPQYINNFDQVIFAIPFSDMNENFTTFFKYFS